MVLFYCANTGPVKCHCANIALAYTIALEFSPTHQWTRNSHTTLGLKLAVLGVDLAHQWSTTATSGRALQLAVVGGVQPYLPVYQQESVHHKRRVHAAHIGDTTGALAGSQMTACCWAPWDISYISHFSKT